VYFAFVVGDITNTTRQQLRADEIIAIEKAIEIISSGAVAGNADKHLPAMLQKQASFSQFMSASNTQVQSLVAQYLQAQAAKLNSRVLSAVAQRAESDPFQKVKKMIKETTGLISPHALTFIFTISHSNII
jgi:hypothetical protein